MRVYHFLPADFALDDIAKQRMKISEINQTNDPFELWCVSHENHQIRRALHEYKEKMAARFGFICFSERWANPLLWSHYADKHRGICLGFDVGHTFVRKVAYVRERTPLRVPVTDEAADRLLWTKYWDWKYEEEWRSWLGLEHREDGHYFYQFGKQPDAIRLRQVIVGPLCDATGASVESALSDYSNDVEILKARLAFRSFRIVKKQDGFRSC